MSETVRCCREWAVYADNAGTVILVHADNEAGEERVRLPHGTHEHCRKCGARFTLREDGEVEVGPSVEKLLAALYAEIAEFDDCPRGIWGECVLGMDDEQYCALQGSSACGACWLQRWGLATTYDEAAALWARMEEAAKNDG